MNAITGLMLAAALVRAGGQNEEASKEVRAALLRLNEAFVKQDAELIGSLMTDDHVAILSVGVRHTKEEALRSLGDFKFTMYATEDLQITLLGNNAALATFRAKIEGTFRGNPYAQDNFASAIWVRQGNRWLERYYQETAARKNQ
jgi:ketosteroid isomerase-like protein